MQRRVPWVLVGIMVLAVALRLPGLGFALEQDELYTLIDAIALFDSPSKPGIAARPFYYLFQHVLLGIGPATPVALRLPPLVFGLAGVWVTWLLGTRVFNPTAGWMAALLVAISPWHLHASGFARYWTLLYLLAAVFYLFLAAAWSSDRPAHYLAALGAALLGSVTHPTFLFAAAGAALGVTLSRPDGTLGWRWPSRRAWQLLWGPWAAGLVVGALAQIGRVHV